MPDASCCIASACTPRSAFAFLSLGMPSVSLLSSVPQTCSVNVRLASSVLHIVVLKSFPSGDRTQSISPVFKRKTCRRYLKSFPRTKKSPFLSGGADDTNCRIYFFFSAAAASSASFCSSFKVFVDATSERKLRSSFNILSAAFN